MGILSTTTNLLATAKSKFNFLLAAANFRPTVDTAAPALYRNSKHESNKNLKLIVQYIHKGHHLHHRVISTENNSFQVLKKHTLPNLSLLRAKYYDSNVRNADYIIRACSNFKWILLTSQKLPEPPFEFLWDPTTGETKSLTRTTLRPPLPFPLFSTGWGLGVGFDPRSPEKEYKVVRSFIFEYQGFHRVRSEVFSLRTDSWKEIPYPLNPLFRPFEDQALHINGMFYWLAFNITDDNLAIIPFNIANEKFLRRLIPMPPSKRIGGPKINVVLAEFHGSLAVVVSEFSGRVGGGGVYAEKKPPCFEIWVWRFDKWSRAEKIFMPAANVGDLSRVVGFYKNDKVLIMNSKGDLLLYDICGEESSRMLENLGIRDQTGHVVVFPFGSSPVEPLSTDHYVQGEKINLSSLIKWLGGILLCSNGILYFDLISYYV